MPEFLSNLLRSLRGPSGKDMLLLCRQLLSQRGEASQTVLARRIIEQYKAMDSARRLEFFEILAREFGPDQNAIQSAIEEYRRSASPASAAALSAAAEAPRQELFRRINTAPAGTENLVAMRRDLLRCLAGHPQLGVVDADLKHLFRSWFNRGFLRVERINWQTSALTLEKLIQYESVHEINGWPDLRRRLEADRRCFAFFQPALPGEPVIFVEVALTHGLARNLEQLLDINAPVLPLKEADTAIFYSINNCLEGLRGIPFGNFLIKQVVDELSAELPKIRSYSTLSPLPHFSRALNSAKDGTKNAEPGFTRDRLSRLLADFATDLTRDAGVSDPVDALFELLGNPVEHQKALTAPLRRLALMYLTQPDGNGRLHDPVAAFHFSNGARLESIDPFANLRPYGLRDSFGVMVNYRYIPEDLEENHERFVRSGEVHVAPALLHERRISDALWKGEKEKSGKK
ncbi:MAG: malonyl-CoA decarboxylase [Acidobacteriia bacterium]|nr:malonyl-CoA decarboxylase [Terriglobia bacterium]